MSSVVKYITLVFWVSFALPVSAACTTPTKQTCKSWLIVFGKNTGQCLEWSGTRNCSVDGAMNSCFTLGQQSGCVKTSEVCVSQKGSLCLKWEREFLCTNTSFIQSDLTYQGHTPVLLDRIISNFSETVTGCENEINDPKCSLDQYDITESGIRLIYGMPYTREFWKRTGRFICYPDGALTNGTCEQYNVDPTCVLQETNCSEYDGSLCKKYKKRFICGQDSTQVNVEKCEPVQTCVGPNCSNLQPEPSEEFGPAMALLNVAGELSKDFDPDTSTFFEADFASCSDAGVFYDCCKDSGFLTDIGLKQCSESERDLALARKNKRAHYLGSHCASSIFGVCLDRHYEYCTFDSIFQRVFHEEVERLTYPYHVIDDECSGFNVYDLEHIPFEKFDASELVPHAVKNSDPERMNFIVDTIRKDLEKYQ